MTLRDLRPRARLSIDTPVFLILGDQDFIFCGGPVNCADPASVAAYEGGFFSAEACLQTALVPNTGHNLSLHTNAGETFTQILNWTDALLAAGQGCRNHRNIQPHQGA